MNCGFQWILLPSRESTTVFMLSYRPVLANAGNSVSDSAEVPESVDVRFAQRDQVLGMAEFYV